jgi:hypothetical protein
VKLAFTLSHRLTFRGLDISVETDKGELRHWYDPHAKKEGTTKMKFPYGYIRRTQGMDGDHVDCYVGPNENASKVYIVHQQKAPDFNTYDEDKCMLGFDSAEQARKAYLDHYNNDRFLGSMTIMSFEEFKRKVLHTMKRPQKLAYDIGSMRAAGLFNPELSKQSQSLGDPNYWQPQAAQDPNAAAPPEGMAPPQSPTAEEMVQGLAAGTFQGLQLKLSPDGQRSTTIKVTPEAIATPEGLQSIFAAEPNAKVEIFSPQAQGGAGGGGGTTSNVPGQPSAGELGELINSKAAAFGRRTALRKLAYGTYNPELPGEFFGAQPGSRIPQGPVRPQGMTQANTATMQGMGGVPGAPNTMPQGMAHAPTLAAQPPAGMTAATRVGGPATVPSGMGARGAPLATGVTKLDPGAQALLSGTGSSRVRGAATAASEARPALGRFGAGLGTILQKMGPRGRMLGLAGGAGLAGAGLQAASN